MTRLGKILVVLIAFVSVAFAGFAILVSYAGPNWQETAAQIDGYKFSLSTGENPTWTAVRARGDEQVASDKNLAAVIDKVLADRLNQLKTETTSFQTQLPTLTAEYERTKAANEADIPALDAYIASERTRLDALHASLAKLEAQVLTQTSEAQKFENIASSRREDVFRISAQLDEVRADQFRLKSIERQLAEELEQVTGNLERAMQRRDQVAVEEYNPEAAPTSEEPGR